MPSPLRRQFTADLGLDPWISHRTKFDDLIDVFPSFTQPETGVIKAIVEVGT
jgi:alcohol dehydrogenase